MNLISRDLYNAAVLINQSATVYEPDNANHQALLASGIAQLNPLPTPLTGGENDLRLILLTQKGEVVVRME